MTFIMFGLLGVMIAVILVVFLGAFALGFICEMICTIYDIIVKKVKDAKMKKYIKVNCD